MLGGYKPKLFDYQKEPCKVAVPDMDHDGNLLEEDDAGLTV